MNSQTGFYEQNLLTRDGFHKKKIKRIIEQHHTTKPKGTNNLLKSANLHYAMMLGTRMQASQVSD